MLDKLISIPEQVDKQLALRQQHTQEWQSHLQAELTARRAMERTHQAEMQRLSRLLAKYRQQSALIKQQLGQVVCLAQLHQQQRQQIRNRQQQELLVLGHSA